MNHVSRFHLVPYFEECSPVRRFLVFKTVVGFELAINGSLELLPFEPLVTCNKGHK